MAQTEGRSPPSQWLLANSCALRLASAPDLKRNQDLSEDGNQTAAEVGAVLRSPDDPGLMAWETPRVRPELVWAQSSLLGQWQSFLVEKRIYVGFPHQVGHTFSCQADKNRAHQPVKGVVYPSFQCRVGSILASGKTKIPHVVGKTLIIN